VIAVSLFDLPSCDSVATIALVTIQPPRQSLDLYFSSFAFFCQERTLRIKRA
jgi:hypothetical protein